MAPLRPWIGLALLSCLLALHPQKLKQAPCVQRAAPRGRPKYKIPAVVEGAGEDTGRSPRHDVARELHVAICGAEPRRPQHLVRQPEAHIAHHADAGAAEEHFGAAHLVDANGRLPEAALAPAPDAVLHELEAIQAPAVRCAGRCANARLNHIAVVRWQRQGAASAERPAERVLEVEVRGARDGAVNCGICKALKRLVPQRPGEEGRGSEMDTQIQRPVDGIENDGLDSAREETGPQRVGSFAHLLLLLFLQLWLMLLFVLQC